MFNKISESTVGDKTKDYFKEKEETKEKWSYAFKKDLPCLKINTTSRLEGINAVIKSYMNSSTSLIQLFYYMLSISESKLNCPYLEKSNYNKVLVESLSKNDIMMHLKTILSDYAYGQSALNLTQAFNYEVKLYKGIYTVIINLEYEIKLQKQFPLTCSCTYYLTIGLPCSHLLSIALKHKDVISNLNRSVRERWLKENNSGQHSDQALIDCCKEFLQKKEGIFY